MYIGYLHFVNNVCRCCIFEPNASISVEVTEWSCKNKFTLGIHTKKNSYLDNKTFGAPIKL